MSKTPRRPGPVRRRLELWRAQYRPKIGLLWPRATVTLKLTPPFGENETPVVVQPNSNDVIIQKAESGTVVLFNTAHYPVPYLLGIVPARYAKLAMIPWAQVALHAPQLAKVVKVEDIVQVLGQFFTKKTTEV